MLSKSRSMVGLDIGSAAVKAIELSQRGRDVEVSAFGQIELGSDSEEEKSRAVRDLMGEGGFKTKRLVTGLSGKAVIIRYLTLVRMSDEELKNAITFEAEKYVPFPLDECVLDCQRLDGDDGRGSTMTVLMVAAKRSTVDEHMRTVNASGLVSEIIDVDAFALANAHALCARQDETLDTSGTIAFVDVGFNRTQVNIVSEGVSLFAREISIGGKDFTDAIAKRLSVGFDEAEELKRDPGEGEDTVRDAVFPTIDDLGNEIHLSFDYFQNQFEREISRIMLSGGGSRIGFFREAFERIFEKPTAIFNPFDHLPVGEGINADLLVCNGPQLVVATGLAARMARAS